MRRQGACESDYCKWIKNRREFVNIAKEANSLTKEKEDEFELLLNRNKQEHWQPEIFTGLINAQIGELELRNRRYIYQTLAPRIKRLIELRDEKLKAQILKENMTIEIRPEILEFAKEMESVMKSHDYKKGDSWKEMDLARLNTLFREEVKEYTKAERADISRDELIDIANIAMMMWVNLSIIIGDKQLSRRREKGD